MTGLAKQLLDHFADICERLEPPPGQDAMDRALVLFTVAVCPWNGGKPGGRDPAARSPPCHRTNKTARSRDSRDRIRATGRTHLVAQQLGADVDFPHFGATKLDFSWT